MLLLFTLHLIADFFLQSRRIANSKSSDPYALLEHIGIIFIVFLPFTSMQFNLLNCAIHALIDWNIWKFYKYYVVTKMGLNGKTENDPEVVELKKTWKFWEDSAFYSTIGIDQYLHMVTLYLLYQWGI